MYYLQEKLGYGHVIDGKTYVFDEDGWMITSDRINANGELT